MDNSPILLRLKSNSAEYIFFRKTLALNGLVAFGITYDPSTFSENMREKGKLKEYNKLQSKFVFDSSHEFTSEISLLQTVLLLGFVDKICKLLLSDESEAILSMALIKFAQWVKSWDSIYLKNAQVLFENYRSDFQQYPKLIEMIDMFLDENKFGK